MNLYRLFHPFYPKERRRRRSRVRGVKAIDIARYSQSRNQTCEQEKRGIRIARLSPIQMKMDLLSKMKHLLFITFPLSGKQSYCSLCVQTTMSMSSRANFSIGFRYRIRGSPFGTFGGHFIKNGYERFTGGV